MASRRGWGIVLGLVITIELAVMGQSGSAAYDPATETKMKGTVQELKFPPKGSEKEAAHLLLKSGDNTVDVYLAPRAFLEDMGSTLAKGDEVSVTGSKVKHDNGEMVLAREVVKGNDTLVLRDDKGKPVWNWHK